MLKAVFYSLVLIFVASPCAAAHLDDGAFDTISIRADEASEDVEPGTLYFKGNFLMRSSEWRITSAKATVYGPLDRPDQVVLEGSPARFVVSRSDEPGGQPVEATAPLVDYLRSDNMLRLSGGAVLKQGDEVIHSEMIEYDLDTERYWAGGAGGVVIEVSTKN